MAIHAERLVRAWRENYLDDQCSQLKFTLAIGHVVNTSLNAGANLRRRLVGRWRSATRQARHTRAKRGGAFMRLALTAKVTHRTILREQRSRAVVIWREQSAVAADRRKRVLTMARRSLQRSRLGGVGRRLRGLLLQWKDESFAASLASTFQRLACKVIRNLVQSNVGLRMSVFFYHWQAAAQASARWRHRVSLQIVQSWRQPKLAASSITSLLAWRLLQWKGNLDRSVLLAARGEASAARSVCLGEWARVSESRREVRRMALAYQPRPPHRNPARTALYTALKGLGEQHVPHPGETREDMIRELKRWRKRGRPELDNSSLEPILTAVEHRRRAAARAAGGTIRAALAGMRDRRAARSHPPPPRGTRGGGVQDGARRGDRQRGELRWKGGGRGTV